MNEELPQQRETSANVIPSEKGFRGEGNMKMDIGGI